MDVLVERCAGLDVHRDDVVAPCAWRAPVVAGGISRRGRFPRRSPACRRSASGCRSAPSRWSGWRPPACTGRRCSRRLRIGLSAGCSTRSTCATSRAARPTSRTPSGFVSSFSTGFVRPSFVPPPEIRRPRDLTRLRKAQINERGRSIQRLEKVLQDAGIKLTRRRFAHLLEVRSGDA